MRTVNALTVVTTRGGGPQKPKLKHTAFDEFVADLDRIVDASTFVNELDTEIGDTDIKDKKWLVERHWYAVRHWVKDKDKVKDMDTICAKCRAFEVLFDEDKWEKRVIHGKEILTAVKPSYVADRLAALISSFPSNGPRHPDEYVSLKLEEVIAFKGGESGDSILTPIVLEAACRQLVRTKNFVPSIAEVLAALNEQDDLFVNRWDALDAFPREREQLKKTWNTLVLEFRKQQEEAKQIEKPTATEQSKTEE